MSSPRSKLRAKLGQKRTEREGTAAKREGTAAKRQKPATVVPVNARDRLSLFPTWVVEQLVSGFGAVVHNPHPFMLLFHFDMTDDPLAQDASALVGSSLDILLVKINGGIYYESSTHMDGLQNRILAAGRRLSVTPAQLLYVCDPVAHVKGATAEITSDVSLLSYVARDIPASFAREGRAWEVPLDPTRHLPRIRNVVDE